MARPVRYVGFHSSCWWLLHAHWVPGFTHVPGILSFLFRARFCNVFCSFVHAFCSLSLPQWRRIDSFIFMANVRSRTFLMCINQYSEFWCPLCITYLHFRMYLLCKKHSMASCFLVTLSQWEYGFPFILAKASGG